ncbi:MAG: cytochrome C oxidase subunit IV family protein [Deltaproteobacteria bacterium]|nr:cytochrome C oxidase subunit IV family protein [Deltaproteobacteria bacterium]
MTKEHGTGYGIYVIVWIALLVLTGATVAVSYANLGLMNVAVALLIASVKASLVALFFMHLKFENKLVWTFALVPIFFLLLVVGGTLSDTLFR